MIFGRLQINATLALAVVFAGCDEAQVNPNAATTAETDRAGRESELGIAQHEVPVNQPSLRLLATDDEMTILGSWRVVEATANGEPYAEGVGTIYTFEANNKGHIVGHDYEAYFDYLVDPSRTPKRLVRFLETPRGEGIYTLEEGILRFQESREPQPLAFDAKRLPRGRWNEYRMTRITPAEAKSAIEKLQDERLRIKASNP